MTYKEKQKLAKKKYNASAKGKAAKKLDDAKYYAKNKAKIGAKQKVYNSNNKKSVVAKQQEWLVNNPDARKKHSKAYYNNNKDVCRERNKIWAKANPNKRREYLASYRAAKLKATPLWVDVEALSEVYSDCNDLQWLSEEPLEVDHIVPLQGKNVCGLHIAENLQIITQSQNRAKGNKYNGNS